ncbi:hypothetical protein [Paenibacillus sp.]|uniref:hypothetical protein n=1 Tax=Paenibacillus sp. TaxID=58172 RepID=UPI002D716D4B|nr:hypothetical protein [Paenibacillus sp.]HZG83517.1 hypothetical protein [Paenibacillus sp.]
MKAWKLLPMLLAAGAALSGCGGQAGDGANANETGRYGMKLYAAGERHAFSGDDFLIVGNSVFIDGGATAAVTDRDVQANFRGMRVYRIDDAAGRDALLRLQRVMGGTFPSRSADAAGADLAALLRSARNWNAGQ